MISKLKSILHFIIDYSLFWSIYANFRLFPFRVAIKMPVLCSSKLSICGFSGRYILDVDKISFGMIRIGISPTFLSRSGDANTTINNHGEIVFRGPVTINRAAKIFVENGATLDLGSDVLISNHCFIIVKKSICIGQGSRIAHFSQLCDSNFHFIEDLTTNVISPRLAPIVIGRYNWIANRTIVNKGTITPDFTIISNGSFLSKDYSNIGENMILAGQPAKVVRPNLRRVWELDRELLLECEFE
ncbi:MAG: acyltransferase [Bacteroidales bacterium]